MEKPRSPIGKATDLEDVERIRKIGYEEGEMGSGIEQTESGHWKGRVLESIASRGSQEDTRNRQRTEPEKRVGRRS